MHPSSFPEAPSSGRTRQAGPFRGDLVQDERKPRRLQTRRTLFFDARGVDVCVDDFVEFDEALDKSSNRVHLVAVNVRRRMADVA